MDTRSRKTCLNEILNKSYLLQDNNQSNENKMKIMKNVLNKTNENYESTDIKILAKNTDEVVTDAKVLNTVTEVLSETIDTVDVSVEAYDPEEFAKNLVNYLRIDDNETILDWHKLDDDILQCCKILPSFSYLYGTFNVTTEDVNQSQSKVKRQRGSKVYSQKTQPEYLKAVAKEEDSVEETVNMMYSILRAAYKENNERPVSYFHFVLDPNDFGKTIENIFHFSFLVRDGAVKIELDEDEIPFVSPVSKRSGGRDQGTKVENSQSVVSLDYEEWEALKETMQISECLYNRGRVLKKY